MAVIETWLEQDLQAPVKVRYLDGNIFSNNGNGNRIGVRVYSNGEPVTLSGTVSGYAVVADGSTVPCTGSRSGNQASILIPPAAYQPGAVFISVFLTDGSTVTTLAAVSTTVMQTRTNSQVSPGSVVTDWTQTINAAMQSVVDANAANMAQTYGELTFPVPMGKYTLYNNLLYRAATPIATSESWTAAHWTRVKLADDVSDLKSALNESNSIISAGTLRLFDDDSIDLDIAPSRGTPLLIWNTNIAPKCDGMIVDFVADGTTTYVVVLENENGSDTATVKKKYQFTTVAGTKYTHFIQYAFSGNGYERVCVSSIKYRTASLEGRGYAFVTNGGNPYDPSLSSFTFKMNVTINTQAEMYYNVQYFDFVKDDVDLNKIKITDIENKIYFEESNSITLKETSTSGNTALVWNGNFAPKADHIDVNFIPHSSSASIVIVENINGGSTATVKKIVTVSCTAGTEKNVRVDYDFSGNGYERVLISGIKFRTTNLENRGYYFVNQSGFDPSTTTYSFALTASLNKAAEFEYNVIYYSSVITVVNELAENTKNEINAVKNDIGELYENVFLESYNLLDPDALTVGVLNNNGTINTSYTGHRTTDYIPVETGNSVCFQNGRVSNFALSVCEYDINKNIVGSRTNYSVSNASYYVFSVSGQNVKYIRLSYQKSDLADGSIMISVSNAPQVYEPFGTYKAINNDFADMQKTSIFANVTDDVLSVVTKYAPDTDLMVTFGKHGANNLPEFWYLSTIANTDRYPSPNILYASRFFAIATDWHGPFLVKALSNIDGDVPESTAFTGGNHNYGGTTSPDETPTAVCNNLKYIIDGKEYTSFNGYCRTIDVLWDNSVQAANTKKANGTGRNVLKEYHRLHFNGYRWESSVQIVPLEDINIVKYYGFQASGLNTIYPNVRFINGANRGVYTGDTNSSSGNKNPNGIMIYGDTHKLIIELDTTYDIGDKQFYEGTSGAFSQSGKVYFFLIENLNPASENNMYSARATYQFVHV